ncbi:uncharacterized protein LOC110856083 [Folsomia candida]|nr:uncharacterized protein LOC110856083 [Folsomia candida]
MEIAREELEKQQPDQAILTRKLQTIQQLTEEAEHYAGQVLDHYVLNNMEDKFRQSRKKWREINENSVEMILRIKTAISIPSRPGSPTGSANSLTSSGGERKIKLPKCNLQKFDGKMRSWLGWWAHYEQIHNDQSLSVPDKFRSLVQSMESGTEAAEIVASFPKLPENYPKAVNMLTQKYGKKDMLVAMYMTDLAELLFNQDKRSISKFFMALQTQLQNLESIGVKSEEASQYLLPMIVKSLPKETLTTWFRSPLSKLDGSILVPPKSKLECLLEFLSDEVESEWKIEMASGEKEKKKSGQRHSPKKASQKDEIATAAGLISANQASSSCIFCGKGHLSNLCYAAQKMNYKEKESRIREKKVCFSCFKFGHRAAACKAKIQCGICNKHHYSLMCYHHPSNKNMEVNSAMKDEGHEQFGGLQSGSSSAMASQECSGTVLSRPLLVRLYDNRGGYRVARLLFDGGAHRTVVRKDTVKRLGLGSIGAFKQSKMVYRGGVTKELLHHNYQLKIGDLSGRHIRTLVAHDEEEIVGFIPRIPRGEWMQQLAQKQISIPDFHSSNPEIEVLVGNDYEGMMMTGRIESLECGVTAIQYVWGWALSGRRPVGVNTAAVSLSLVSCQASITSLWSLESLGITDPAEVKSKTEREEDTLRKFGESVTQKADGRFSVRLPWIVENPQIPDNRFIAEKRLLSGTKKLLEKNKIREYGALFKQWVEEGFIEEVSTQDDVGKKIGVHYLPHHPVFKPQSLTTPVRPVFDASCKTGRNPSLNDCLEKGPNLLELIPSLILRFREKKIGVMADIRKAFQMLEVDPVDRNYLRFLWWEDDEKRTEIKLFRHCRVVFGVNSSPFLLGAVIGTHLKTTVPEYQEVAKKVAKSLYVDNLVTSVDTVGELEELRSKSVQLLAAAKMELRQWECSECQTGPGSDYISHSVTSVLGMKWDKKEDYLFVSIPKNELPAVITRRTLLSHTQSVFDPMGYLSPATIIPKILLQESWKASKSWDEHLDEKIEKEFREWWGQIGSMEKVHIPRNIRVDDGGSIRCHLLQGKSRVTPIRPTTTIPRLELMGCVILARLMSTVVVAMSLQSVEKYFWSDSTTALAWVKRNKEWGTFVGNRVKEICKLSSPNEWSHIAGPLNPADLPSRGCSPTKLVDSRWWEGPEWLSRPQEEWPVSEEVASDEAVEKEKKIGVSLVSVEATIPWYARRYSLASRNIRLVAWILRFVSRCKRATKEAGNLSQKELWKAEKVVMSMIQSEVFSKEEWKNKAQLKIKRSEDGLLVVETKLVNSEEMSLYKFPILLPHSHEFVAQLIREEHLRHAHGGIQFLMGKLREKYWIIQSRRAIRKIVNRCVKCRRFAAKSQDVESAPLPRNRILDAVDHIIIFPGRHNLAEMYIFTDLVLTSLLLTCAIVK